jgi:acyl-CoA synthetase (AMP-forming)/AMP-acid ligase II
MSDPQGFNLSRVFATVAQAVPDQEVLVWRDRRLTYREMDARIDGVAHFLASTGLGAHTARDELAGHESGQDLLGLYLRNGNEYLETMVAAYRARLAPFNVNFRYVSDELIYVFRDARAKVLAYHAEFAPQVAAIREHLPDLEVLIQVDDESGNDLLPGAVAYESLVTTPPPAARMPKPSPDDVYVLYTGGTTGMPKGVLWRQDDIYVSAMGGTPFGSTDPFTSYDAIAAAAVAGNGGMRLLMIPPFMHGAAQWATFHAITNGGSVLLPDDVVSLDAPAILELAIRERAISLPVVGDAVARPIVEELERNTYDLSGLAAVNNGGAPLSPAVKNRLLAALPHILLMDAVGSSEAGIQMTSYSVAGTDATTGTFSGGSNTIVVDDFFTRVVEPGEESIGWLAQGGRVPLGYLGDAEKSGRTFPVIEGIRYAVPGDRARRLANGDVELLGRDSTTINSGGEKIYAEEVERAMAGHPAIVDVVVVGRPSERWGNEVVAIVQLQESSTPTDAELLEECARHVARYKVPKAILRRTEIRRSPAGKADYRWARAQANESASAVPGPGSDR